MSKNSNFITNENCKNVSRLVNVCFFRIDDDISAFKVQLTKKGKILYLWPMDGIATFNGKTFVNFKKLLKELLKEKLITERQMNKAMKEGDKNERNQRLPGARPFPPAAL